MAGDTAPPPHRKDTIKFEMGLAAFRRYYDNANSKPSGAMRYYNVNDRQRANFPANRLALLGHLNVEIAFKIDYIAFSLTRIAFF